MKRMVFLMAALAAMAGSAWAGTTPVSTALSGSTNTMRGVEIRLEDASNTFSTDATRVDETTLTQRFATEFGVTTDVVTQQRTQFNANWGDLFLAYSIANASKTSVTIDQIFTLRQSGQTWTQIARSLRIPPGRLMRSVNTGATTIASTSSGTTTRGRSGSQSGGSGSTNAMKGLNRQIDTRLQTLNDEATRVGDTEIATRLSQDFGVTTDVLTQEKTQFNADWGDLLVAYTIQSRASADVTIDQILTRFNNGETWTQIARSLRVPPGQLLRGIRTETQTFTGTTARTGGTETATSGTTRLHGKGGASMKGGGSALKTSHGQGAAMRVSGSATATTKVSSTTTLLDGRGAMMRAAARGTVTTHGHK